MRNFIENTYKENIEEFYETIRDNYPDLTYEQIKDICETPYAYVRSVIESETLESVRIKYLGQFKVYPGKVKALLENIKRNYENSKITKEEYDKKKYKLEAFLNKNK